MHETAEWVHDPRPEEDAPRERSPYEEEEWSRGRQGYYNVARPGQEKRMLLVAACNTLKICVVHVHNIVKWDSACTELRSMYNTCLGMQVDIVCGDGNQAWYFRSKAHKQERNRP